jgi:hypothetical protein
MDIDSTSLIHEEYKVAVQIKLSIYLEQSP